MSEVRRWLRRKPKPLGLHIDVYQCLGCGDVLVVNADAQTFRKPPPLECHACGNPDMHTGRYTFTTGSLRDGGRNGD